jgi:pyruvate formate lyase activating enzyme
VARCRVCGRDRLVAAAIGACGDCLREGRAEGAVEREAFRGRFDLPSGPPRDEGGAQCGLCANECRVAEGAVGFCGVRVSTGGRMVPRAGADRAFVSWYYDPLPTNCVSSWVCAGGTGAGYPDYAHCDGPERGFSNLAVFYNGCSFDCLFCQNWHHRELPAAPRSAEELASAAEARTSCICYFGGDPTPQMEHALAASRLGLERSEGGILRICWETNGSMAPGLLRQAARLSLESGGTVKFDLKAFSEPLHRALCGVSNQRTLSNFRTLVELAGERPVPPLATASTLLVPGYVDDKEVAALAGFIAGLDPSTPYSLLAFHPDFAMQDLPTTSRAQAQRCLETARAAGLRRVRVGNIHLLG